MQKNQFPPSKGARGLIGIPKSDDVENLQTEHTAF